MALQLQNASTLEKPRGRASAAARTDRALLIVNADDWGGMREGTDAIERCFEAGAITSTTAMVFMDDTERARDIAVLGGRPVGLHLNLTQEYERAPAGARERQLRVIPHFRRMALRRWAISPRPSVRRLICDVIGDQIEEFHRLYRHDPTHLDSHNHAHVCPDVMIELPRELSIRQTMSPEPGSRSMPRAFKRRCLARRFESTDRLWNLANVHPELGGNGLDEALDAAWSESVEIVCHPSFPEELELLLSDGWRRELSGRPLGGFGDLRP